MIRASAKSRGVSTDQAPASAKPAAPAKPAWHDGPAVYAVLGLAALALFFPGVASFGFWDPHEVKIADAARNLIDGKSTWLASPAGRTPGSIWLTALGFSWLGIDELGGRGLIALAAVAAVLATFWVGDKLLGRRAATIGALGLMVAPGFLLSARQLTSFALPTLGTTLGVGGLLIAFAPPGDLVKQLDRRLGLALALVGLLLGAATVGFLSGLFVPLLVVLAARAYDDGRARWLLGAASLAAIAAFFLATKTKGYSWTLAGNAHWPTHATVWTSQLKQLGFAFFPWVALAPIALALLLRQEQRTYSGLALAAWSILGYGVMTVQISASVEQIAPIGAALALTCGWYLDRALTDNEPLPLDGLLVGLVAIFIGRDYVVAPEEYIGAHLSEAVRWPGIASRIPQALVAVAALWGGLVGLALGAPLASPKATPEVAAQQQKKSRRFLLAMSLVTSLGLALATAHFIVPEMSKHLSSKDLYSSTRKLNPNAPIAQYKFNASGSSYYSGGQSPKNLATLDEVWGFLGKSERVFIMAGAEELAALDQAAQQGSHKYYVVDDSNSRYLVISNQLGGTETDKNPLRQFVLTTAPTPKTPISVDLEGKLELIGYDIPNDVARGRDFKVRLYFRVVQPLGGNYKVFMHFDGGGSRFNGDHTPVGGRYPTQNWVPGSFIIDEYTVTPDRAQQPTATFQVYAGLFQGDKRLKVTKGDHDGENRIKLGRMIVK